MNLRPTISVIIPAWREGKKLLRLAEIFKDVEGVEVIAALAEGDMETVLPGVDDIVIVRSPAKGRARQMIEGVRASSGEFLLFLHADTLVDPNSLENVRSALLTQGVAGGAYRIQIDSEALRYKAWSAIINLRSRWFKLPYGDQAIFIKRELYDAIDGFEDVPIMEDIRLVSAMKMVGWLVILDDVAVTSARKWEKDGFLYGTLRNWLMLMAHKMGVSPEKLVSWYYKD